MGARASLQHQHLITSATTLPVACCCCATCRQTQVGEFLLVAVAFALPCWRHVTLAAGCLNAACLLLYPFVPESARWMLSQGRVEEATAALQRIAAANGSCMPLEPLATSGKQPAAGADNCSVAAEEGALPCEDPAATATSSSSCSVCDDSAGGPDSKQPGSAMGLRQILGQRRLGIRLAVLLVTWFSLMAQYYGLGLGAGGIPGSM